MPYELYFDNNLHTYNKLKDVPKENYEKTTALNAIEMKLRDITNIGLMFPNLEQLDVGLNNIKILDLSYFHNLKFLRCNRSRVKEIIGLEYCHKLEQVEMMQNKLNTISSNDNINSLCLTLNYLTNLPHFKNLEILNVAGNPNLISLGRMPKLKELYINNSYIKDFEIYMELEVLDCSNNEAIKKIYPYPKLRELICYNSHINKSNLPYLPSLENLVDKRN